MVREEKQKAINALKISAPVIAVTQEEFNDYIQTLNKIMDWLEQEPCENTISKQTVPPISEDIAKAFQFGMAIGFAERYDAMDKVIEKLKTIATPEQESRWIPVSERLPDPDVEVLVTDDAGGLATISTDSMYENEVTGEKGWYTSQNVTAWMPSPEPYKAESEE